MTRGMTLELEVSFRIFWDSYPRKRGKLEAMRAWRRLKPNDDEVLAITIGVRRYIDSGEWKDPQFIPYPATFLNGRRWEDEVGGECKCHKFTDRLKHEWTANRDCPIHRIETPQPRYCAICGHTGSWHLNETKHRRAPDHQFVESIAVAS